MVIDVRGIIDVHQYRLVIRQKLPDPSVQKLDFRPSVNVGKYPQLPGTFGDLEFHWCDFCPMRYRNHIQDPNAVFESDFFYPITVWFSHLGYFFEFASHSHVFRHDYPFQESVWYANKTPTYIPTSYHEQQHQGNEPWKFSPEKYPYEAFCGKFRLEQSPKWMHSILRVC